MNKVRRKELQELYDIISEAKDRLEMLHDEEEEYKDNMPENLQSSERYERAEAAADALDSAVSSLEEALDYIHEKLKKQLEEWDEKHTKVNYKTEGGV